MQALPRSRLYEQLKAMSLLHAFKWCRRGAENPHGIGSYVVEKLADIARFRSRAVTIAVGDKNSGQHGERRIEHGFAVSRLALVERLEPLRACELKRVVIGHVGLDDHFTRFVPAARASRHLREQLKCPFCRTEVRK